MNMTTSLNIAAYDKDGIWAVGETQELALSEASAYFQNTFPPDAVESLIENLKFAPISQELQDKGTGGGEDIGDVTIMQSAYPHKLDENGVLILDPDAPPVEDNSAG
jgi:hypothetical protein